MTAIALIAAQAENRVIGGDNKLLWHIPEDFRHFKSLTMGKPIIMGRKTYDSIGRPLPKRPNIVITRQKDWQAEGVIAAGSLAEAFKLAESFGPEEIMVIGGAGIYAQALPFATTVYLTHIHKAYDGDALFPELPAKDWRETERRKGDESPDGLTYDFITYQRI